MDENPIGCELKDDLERRGCDPDGTAGRSAFIISEDALQRLIEQKEKKEPTTWKIFEKHEKSWRDKEKCVDNAHANKVGIDVVGLGRLEKSLKDMSGNCKYLCEYGEPVKECYINNSISSLKCRGAVIDYLKCIAEFRASTFGEEE